MEQASARGQLQRRMQCFSRDPKATSSPRQQQRPSCWSFLDSGGVRQLSLGCQVPVGRLSSGSFLCGQAAVDWNVEICGAVQEVALCEDFGLPLLLPAALAGPTLQGRGAGGGIA